MGGNEFIDRERSEQDGVNKSNIVVLIGLVKEALVSLSELKKEQRTIRQELRNIDKLRPLRNKDEEVEETPVGASGEQTV